MSVTQIKPLALSDLKLGMHVNTAQLREIYDIHILLGHSKIADNNTVEGDIVFIGDDTDESIEEICKNNGGIASVFHDSTESLDDAYYEDY